MVCELLPLICTSLTCGAPGSLAGCAVPCSQVPLAMMCGVNASSISVRRSPFLIVMDAWTNCASFIWTVFPVVLAVESAGNTVHMNDAQFVQASITIKKGE